MLPLLVLLGTIAGAWYLLIVRPQQDQQSRHGQLVDRLQVGDHVLTVGGIYGRVVAVEGSSVVLELAPGLQSRIATDGIARIVQAGDARLPSAAPQQQTIEQARTPDMHQEQQHSHEQPMPQFSAPAWAPPQQPYAAPQYQQAHMPAPAPAPASPATTVLRAHVVDAIPSFEPRPWGDLVPRNAPPVAHAQPVAHVAQPVHLHAPFVAPIAHAAPVQLQTLVAHAPAHHGPAAPDAAPIARRKHSRAPQNMGSSLRLDDPTLRDAMDRARNERSELAGEYRKLTAPLVDTSAGAPQPQQHATTPAAMPRPVVGPPSDVIDPALSPSAFQRRAPYAPDPALQPELAPAQAPVPAPMFTATSA